PARACGESCSGDRALQYGGRRDDEYPGAGLPDDEAGSGSLYLTGPVLLRNATRSNTSRSVRESRRPVGMRDTDVASRDWMSDLLMIALSRPPMRILSLVSAAVISLPENGRP